MFEAETRVRAGLKLFPVSPDEFCAKHARVVGPFAIVSCLATDGSAFSHEA